MESLKNLINLIDQAIINMAHLQELPHDLLRGDIEESIAKTQKIISSYPDVEKPFKALEKAYLNAFRFNNSSTTIDDKTENYQFMLELIQKVSAKISKAESEYQLANLEAQQSENNHKEMIKSHSISLLSDIEILDFDINVSAINKTSALQRMKNAENAITLLTLKSNLFKKIMMQIDLEAKREYYRETMNRFHGILNDFAAEFDKLKAAALLAYPNIDPHDSVAMQGNESYSSGLYSDVRIDKRIYDIFKGLGYYPDDEHEISLKKATQESLTADLGESDFISYTDKQYKNYLSELSKLRNVAV